MFTLRHELETILIIFLAAIVGFVFIIHTNHQPQFHFATTPTLPLQTSPTPIPSPTPQIWKSPDGMMELTMSVAQNKNATKTYTLAVADSSGNNAKTILTKTMSDSGTITIPFNSWSPDKAYVFLQDTENGSKDTFVLKTSGDAFSNGQQYLDITSLFAAHLPNYHLTDITGWAAPGLIVVNTNNQDNSQGPSFWFDIGSQGFIQLATRFN